jgi:hypothetical protein
MSNAPDKSAVPAIADGPCAVSAIHPGLSAIVTHAPALTSSTGVRTCQRSRAAGVIVGICSVTLAEDADAPDADLGIFGNRPPRHSKGNLWGTTSGYGSDLGSIYELIPGSGGQWTIKVLQTFHGDEINGGVTFDGKGNVYSTAAQGGTSKNCSDGCCMVFQVSQ